MRSHPVLPSAACILTRTVAAHTIRACPTVSPHQASSPGSGGMRVSLQAFYRGLRSGLLAPRRLLVVLGVCAGFSLGCFLASRATVANHLGYALSGPYGLPFRVHYAGRDYENSSTCAGAAWCRGSGPPDCTTCGCQDKSVTA